MNKTREFINRHRIISIILAPIIALGIFATFMLSGTGIVKLFFLATINNEGIRDIIGSEIVWDGIVETGMTYGRIKVKKVPRDERYPYFIVEDYDSANLSVFEDMVRVWGKVSSVDCDSNRLGLKNGQCIPWVLVKKINNL